MMSKSSGFKTISWNSTMMVVASTRSDKVRFAKAKKKTSTLAKRIKHIAADIVKHWATTRNKGLRRCDGLVAVAAA
jgi:hypothetical protein